MGPRARRWRSKCMRANGVTHSSDSAAGPEWQRRLQRPDGRAERRPGRGRHHVRRPGAPYCSEGVRGVSAAQRPSLRHCQQARRQLRSPTLSACANTACRTSPIRRSPPAARPMSTSDPGLTRSRPRSSGRHRSAGSGEYRADSARDSGPRGRATQRRAAQRGRRPSPRPAQPAASRGVLRGVDGRIRYVNANAIGAVRAVSIAIIHGLRASVPEPVTWIRASR